MVRTSEYLQQMLWLVSKGRVVLVVAVKVKEMERDGVSSSLI